MTATTELYLALQRIYRAKADEHVAAVLAHAHAILAEQRRDSGIVMQDAARAFCKHARALRVVRFRSLVAEAAQLDAQALCKVRDTWSCTLPLRLALLIIYCVASRRPSVHAWVLSDTWNVRLLGLSATVQLAQACRAARTMAHGTKLQSSWLCLLPAHSEIARVEHQGKLLRCEIHHGSWTSGNCKTLWHNSGTKRALRGRVLSQKSW